MGVVSFVTYTLTSKDFTYRVISEVVFSTDQSVMSLLKTKHMLQLIKKCNEHLILSNKLSECLFNSSVFPQK